MRRLALLATAVFSSVHAQDTSVKIERRDIMVAEAGEDGSRFIVDVITVATADSGVVSWSAAVPATVIGLQIAEGDFPPQAIRHVADRIEVAAPMAAGRSRIVLHYVLPPTTSRWELTFSAAVDTVVVIAREGDVVPRGPSFAVERPAGVPPGAFVYLATEIPPGTVVRFVPPRAAGGFGPAWWIIVAAAALALATGFVRWAWRTGALARERAMP